MRHAAAYISRRISYFTAKASALPAAARILRLGIIDAMRRALFNATDITIQGARPRRRIFITR